MAKKDKKKAKQQDDYWDTEFQEDAAQVNATTSQEQPQAEGNAAEAKDPVMDDLADNFGGLMAALKKSKGKKSKKQAVEMVDANEELEAMDESAPVAAATGDAKVVAEEKDDAEDAGEFRVKTKKEKEKEKKEKEKAKKKAQVCPSTGDTLTI